jgi:hypothetical protein
VGIFSTVVDVVPEATPSIKIVAPFGLELTFRDPRSLANVTESVRSEITLSNVTKVAAGILVPSFISTSM